MVLKCASRSSSAVEQISPEVTVQQLDLAVRLRRGPVDRWRELDQINEMLTVAGRALPVRFFELPVSQRYAHHLRRDYDPGGARK
jgi:hypothetical protein